MTISRCCRAKLRAGTAGFICATSCWGLAALLSVLAAGCGRVVAQKATEQLIAGDAVDRSVSQVDFRILTGKKVFLDTQYVNKTVPGVGFVTPDYIISSIRQKMMCDGCLLQEKMEQADFVVEMRIGALGADGHEVIYGMPPNNYLNLAASVVQTPPTAVAAMPSMPEISLAKKNDQMAAAKIALFAYNRVTREPIWQSGLSESRSTVADRWYMGAGPFHKGSIYSGKKSVQEPPIFGEVEESEDAKRDYFVERRFADPTKSLQETPAAKPVVAAATPAKPAVGAASAATAVAAPAATATPAATVTSSTPAASAASPGAKPGAPAGSTSAANGQKTSVDPKAAAKADHPTSPSATEELDGAPDFGLRPRGSGAPWTLSQSHP